MNTDPVYGAKAIVAFKSYWRELLDACQDDTLPAAGRCSVPQRRSFNPMKIHACLPHVYITELISDTMIEVRLSGTAIDENAGQSLKGSNFLDMCGPAERPFHVAICHALTSCPCGVEMTRRVTLRDGRVNEYKSVSFPLADKEGAPRFIVGIANIAEHISFVERFEKAQQIHSAIKDFNFIDIGVGVPSSEFIKSLKFANEGEVSFR